MDETEQRLSKAKALIPLQPIPRAAEEAELTQWPMVNLRAREAEKAAQMFAKQKVLDQNQADEKFFETSTSTNKQVANILDAEPAGESMDTKVESKVTIDDAAWGDDDDLYIDEEIGANAYSN
jgi:hypothetical protein